MAEFTSNIGGLLSMWLGFSLFGFYNLNEKFLLRIANYFWNKRKNQSNKPGKDDGHDHADHEDGDVLNVDDNVDQTQQPNQFPNEFHSSSSNISYRKSNFRRKIARVPMAKRMNNIYAIKRLST